MKKLLAMFKSLPPEVRMMLAMAGLATPLGGIYFLRRLFPGLSQFQIIMIVAGVIIGISLLGLVISKVFGRGKVKRRKRMENELASDVAAGGAADVRAAIKANNEKFFNAIRDLRRNVGLSVYDLPWYIVIGDSGCGKTKLVNEGGLTFSTGKPEGYQLGTLNYNWWFTEDAIFVDMAGRLCNPRDDADRREWEAFLNTIAKGRKGFPVNGALVCVSAEHLLQDAPEQIERDANTTLERLRDLQAKLGVTFATYVIVTKCDKILGFMQFFDRAERDITFKNQIFGWSKPGAFNELYDPEQFREDADDLYARLNELRLRRLQDEADEVDLGLAYSFPEEFRELFGPLQTYVRTLFPLIKNPRAIKNLIFRGIYFTSATQEGSLILKHLTERLGSEAATQFAPLDLYPNKRPHFIKDLLLRKVIPENGLVFRNEEQVLRNRKLTQILKWGSVALFVLLVCTLGLSSYKFGAVIGAPRADAQAAQPAQERTPGDALKMGGALGGDVHTLQANLGWARLLSLNVGVNEPINHLNAIRAAVFEQGPMREALTEVGAALRTRTLLDPRAGAEAQQAAREFADALEQYVAWFASSRDARVPGYLDLASFQTLCKVVTGKESALVAQRDVFDSESAAYFNVAHDQANWRNPARLLTSGGTEPAAVILAALRTMHTYLAGFATLNQTHPDPTVAEWMRIQAQCAVIQSSYAQMLAAASDQPQTLEELLAFKDAFVASYDAFAAAVDDCTWRGKARGVYTIVDPLRPELLKQREIWTAYEKKLKDAYARGSTTPDEAVGRALAALSGGSNEAGLPGLDRVLWENLQKAKLTDREFSDAYFEAFKDVVKEVPDQFSAILSFEPGGGTKSDELRTTAEVAAVKGVLTQIHDRLSKARFDAADVTSAPAQWIEELNALLEAEEPTTQVDLGALSAVWQPDKLRELYAAHLDLVALGEGRRLLNTIQARLDGVGEWGVAELQPDWNAKVPSVYQIPLPRRESPRAESREEPAGKETAVKRSRRAPRGRRSRRTEQPEPRRSATVTIEGDRVAPVCATRDFLSDRAEECASLLYALRDFDEDFYFTSADDDQPLNTVCIRSLQRAGEMYMNTYVQTWADAYQKKSLSEVGRLLDSARDWKSLADQLQRSSGDRAAGRDQIADELQAAVSEVLKAVPFWRWYYSQDTGQWSAAADPDDRDWLEVSSWMQKAIEGHWNAGRFAVDARLPVDELAASDRGAAPWDAVAGEFVRRWKALAKGIATHGVLPTKFDSDAKPDSVDLIPWGGLSALRREARLDDEKLTGQLLDFQAHAQALLSTALTNVLSDIQARHLPDVTPYDGWPYLDESGGGLTALQTVPFEDFKRFTLEIERAWKQLEPLERGLPQDQPAWTARDAFYKGCRDWNRFMRIDSQLKPADLAVDIEGGDPVTAPFGKERVHDTAQHYYDAVALDLGLAIVGDDQPGTAAVRPLRMATLQELKVKVQHAVWRWSSPAGQSELTVALIEGHSREGVTRNYPNVAITLGQASPLALCAYLHRNGVRYEDKWVTSHAFDLVQEFNRRGKGDLVRTLDPDRRIVGEKFLFRLERPLPDPIRRLERR